MAEGGERTERATPRQRRRARERGQVAKSNEITSALSLLALFLTLWFAGSRTQGLMTGMVTETVGAADSILITDASISKYASDWILLTLSVLLPFFAAAVVIGLGTQVMQAGIVFSAHPLKPDLSRLDPVRGLKRIFSMRGLFELFKGLLKIVIVGAVVWAILRGEAYDFPRFLNTDITSSFMYSFALAVKIGVWTSAVLLILAILDYLYQHYEHEKSLMMTKQEVKDEFKTMEGDPLIRRHIRERGRQIAMARMMQEAAKADVLITNPEHYAVAVVYEIGMAAPRVVAKGKGFVALRLREIAKDNGISIIEDPPLARALYRVELGAEIPIEHFRAVAQILAFLARQDERLRRRITAGQAA